MVGTIPLGNAGSSFAGGTVAPVWRGMIYGIANSKLDVVLGEGGRLEVASNHGGTSLAS